MCFKRVGGWGHVEKSAPEDGLAAFVDCRLERVLRVFSRLFGIDILDDLTAKCSVFGATFKDSCVRKKRPCDCG